MLQEADPGDLDDFPSGTKMPAGVFRLPKYQLLGGFQRQPAFFSSYALAHAPLEEVNI